MELKDSKTMKNLFAAFAGESQAHTKYQYYAAKARENGFEQIAFLFENVAKIEKEHEERYRKLISNINDGLVFSRDGDAIWQCRNCGHIFIGKGAPEICPVCSHAKAYFQIKPENY